MNGWFGKSWGAPVCEPETHQPTPVGQSCLWCDEPIAEGDGGFIVPYISEKAERRPMHYECQMRSILGGANHLRRLCTCCGGKLPPDPPGLTKREAAKLAVSVAEGRRVA